ncbi:MAG: glycerophosphodiester phosphodiesterase [Pseudomonadota bacterium]
MWPYPKIVAHRGGGSLAPENTIAAMRCGLAHGFRAVEFDVMLSRDGIPILMHDENLGRTAKGEGRICDWDASHLAMLDAGSWFGPAFAGELVPRFEEVIRFCRTNAIWMNVEIKPVPGFEEATGRIAALMVRRLFGTDSDPGKSTLHNPHWPLLSSFSFEALMAAKSATPELARGFLIDAIPPDWQTRLHNLGAIALHTNHLNLTEELARAVKDAGFGLFCYTVNSTERAKQLLAWGVDGFCTDQIDLIGPHFGNRLPAAI